MCTKGHEKNIPGIIVEKARKSETTQLFLDGRMDQSWYFLTMEYYTVFKKEGNSDTCLVCMNSEVIMLNEVSQSQRTDNRMTQLM